MSDITSQSLTSLVKNIKEKKLSSEDVTKAFVERSEKSKELNSYISEDFSNAINKAKKFDEKPNLDLKLPGIPMAVKDLFCTKDIRTTAGSKILENFIPTYESTVTQNIWNEGGILLGKLNCDEFAWDLPMKQVFTEMFKTQSIKDWFQEDHQVDLRQQ